MVSPISSRDDGIEVAQSADASSYLAILPRYMFVWGCGEVGVAEFTFRSVRRFDLALSGCKDRDLESEFRLWVGDQ